MQTKGRDLSRTLPPEDIRSATKDCFPASPADLSVIITCFNARACVEACLESLRAQRTTHRFEVLLVDSSQDGTAELVGRRFPEVRLLHHPERLYCGSARNLALPLATASVVAFLDADCLVPPQWVEAVLAAHHSGHLVAGGIIDNGTPGSLAAWAYYFCEFSHWLPSSRPREVREMAGCCLSFEKDLYQQHGPFLEGGYCSDTVFLRTLSQNGHRIMFVPAIRVWHTFSDSTGSFLKHQFEHRRWYGRVCFPRGNRRRVGQWLYFLSLPLHPALLLGAVAWRLRRHPAYAGYFLLSVPLVAAGLIARVLGEAFAFLEPRVDGVRAEWR
jgi:GT2 family glycosyltransferase